MSRANTAGWLARLSLVAPTSSQPNLSVCLVYHQDGRGIGLLPTLPLYPLPRPLAVCGAWPGLARRGEGNGVETFARRPRLGTGSLSFSLSLCGRSGLLGSWV
ncbi:hypothetical protein B0T16DRAFT_34601 [Cercophora newfieldiana]|uniref:Secreted protein n=1 Tax=Cercophora newfieldiana TaxID=92897 RepID=A0AA39YPM5_9PEZI|nr:hypothetical protein B0T16DRAFT_34601 [Cercophora newfieldiana]